MLQSKSRTSSALFRLFLTFSVKAMSFAASLDWLCEHVAVLRVHPDNGGFGDPYVWSVNVVKRGTTAYLVNTLVAPKMAWVRAGTRALREAGFTRIVWERKHAYPHSTNFKV